MDVIAKRTKSFAITSIDTEKADFAGQPFVCCGSVVYWSEDEAEGVFLRNYQMFLTRPCSP